LGNIDYDELSSKRMEELFKLGYPELKVFCFPGRKQELFNPANYSENQHWVSVEDRKNKWNYVVRSVGALWQ